MNVMLFISAGEIFIVFLFALIFFGADKLPEIARGLGKGMREFKKAADDLKGEFSNSDLSSQINEIQRDLTNAIEENVAKPLDNMQNELATSLEESTNEINKNVQEAANSFNESAQEAATELNRSVDSINHDLNQPSSKQDLDFPVEDFYYTQENSELPQDNIEDTSL